MLGRFLILDPDLETAEVVADACRAYRATDVVASVDEALDSLRSSKRLVALITELELTAGDGIEFLRYARKLRPLLPVLVLTSRAEPSSINAAHGLRAEYHCKPTHRASLRGFLRRAVAFERVEDQRIGWAVDEWSKRHRLTPREVDILVAAVAGVPRRTLSDELGVSENTLKTQVRGLLRKTDHATVEELARATLQLALADDTPRRTIPPSDPLPLRPHSIRPSGTRRKIDGSSVDDADALKRQRG